MLLDCRLDQDPPSELGSSGPEEKYTYCELYTLLNSFIGIRLQRQVVGGDNRRNGE